MTIAGWICPPAGSTIVRPGARASLPRGFSQHRWSRVFLVVLWVTFLVTGVGQALPPDETLGVQMRALHPFLGGDGCYSVPIPGQGTLLLFGDTFMASGSSRDRREAAFVHNTAILAAGEVQPGTSLQFVPDRLPFLPSPATDTYVWPLDGLFHNGRLYLFAVEIRQIANDPFGFREAGNLLFVVDNPLDPIARWTMQCQRIPWARFGRKSSLLWGASVLRHDGQILVYGVYQGDNGKKALVLARTDGPPDEFGRWQFFRRSGLQSAPGGLPDESEAWGAAPSAPSPLLSPMPTEFTVFFSGGGDGEDKAGAAPSPTGRGERGNRAGNKVLPPLRRPPSPAGEPRPGVFCLVSSGDGGLSGEVIQHTALSPWFAGARRQVLHRCAEHGGADGIFCYSAKAVRRPDGAPPRRVVYFTNSTAAEPLLRDLRYYWPLFYLLDGNALPSAPASR